MNFTVEEFLFNTSLYEWIEVTEENKREVELLISSTHSRDFEGYNPIDGIETTFQNKNTSYQGYSCKDLVKGYTICTLMCKRTEKEFKFYLFGEVNGDSIRIEKIGQFPSLADFHLYKLKKYKKSILPKDKALEFSKAIGLAAHGIGIGSFVYLRRIFEYLISSTFENNKAQLEIPEKDFSRLRMDEKITILKDNLPQFLVNNKHIYSILSKGIHELEEEQCSKFFPILKQSIEIMLDELAEAEEKERRRKEIEKAIQEMHTEVK